MKNIYFYALLITLLSCNNSDRLGKCSLVSCLNGDIIKLEFISNEQNIFETSPPTDFTITQNNLPIHFEFTIDYLVSIDLGDSDPIQIIIDDTQLNMEISSTYIERECCSGIRVDSIIINNSEICTSNELCDEIIQINID
ncbi:hypothetical protein H8K90_09080 [Winogradskyella echinorum]|uniref:Uncharacterized protein n=1 Tax=Winogradskyella echinorum TaxID=538189 RepID=A0ABR6Y1C2_9FLAO|nr:hypothetical protein [Winogradskyella echinorum]MBC3846532.1 hypothetical protein [Winogradskyella echinorum]MBC5750880.1 hypothetical protein [Winogradskyella echinorum]